MKIRAIITGATGMVGKGVLLECLEHPEVEKVLVINRSPIQIKHDKLEELVISDFTKIGDYSKYLTGYNACFYCLGVSVLGLNEEAYSKITFDLTKLLADILIKVNPNTVFTYISGEGTDSTEKGKTMWARVKGKTENYVLNRGFKDAYAFRPGVIIPEKGTKSKVGWYNALYVIMRPLFPILKKSKRITTTTNVGLAMINVVLHPTTKKHLENIDINRIALNQ